MAVHKIATTMGLRDLAEHMKQEFRSLCEVCPAYRMAYFDEMVYSICEAEFVMACMSKLRKYDKDTYIHSVRVGALCMIIGDILGLDDDTIHDLGIAGLFHDIGKKFVPDRIIHKDGSLDGIERSIIQAHVAMSAYYLEKKYGILNDNIILGVAQHHERLDGSGYPEHLSGSDIRDPGRIVAIADVMEAYSSKRAYHDARSMSDTIVFLGTIDGLDRHIIDAVTEHMDASSEKLVV